MQINGKHESLDSVLEAGLEVHERALESLRSRGIDPELCSSVLAVAAAGAMTSEGLAPSQFLSILRQTLRLWSLEGRSDGPVLVFTGVSSPSEQLAAAGN